MNYTLGKSRNEVFQLREAIADLVRSYDCDWNDVVHDSYRVYVEMCKRSAFEISQVMEDLEKSCSPLHDIDPDSLIRESAAVCQKIESFEI